MKGIWVKRKNFYWPIKFHNGIDTCATIIKRKKEINMIWREWLVSINQKIINGHLRWNPRVGGLYKWEQESIWRGSFFLERLGLVMIIFGGFFWEGEKKARVWRGGVLERYTSITYFLYFLGKNREKVSSGEWFDVRSLLLPLLLLLLLLFLTLVFLCRWKSIVDGGIHNLSLISFRQRCITL